MAIEHAASGQVVDIHSGGSQLPSSKTFALFKAKDLEVMRLVLPVGKAFPPHSVPGEITVQCLEGKIEFTAQGSTQVLRAGQLLYLTGGIEHGLVALEDSSVLVTIVLRK